MDTPSPSRRTRNAIFLAILAVTTAALLIFRANSGENEPTSESPTDEQPAASADGYGVIAPGQPDESPPPKPETLAMTFQEYARQYDALRDDFRGRDSLTARVAGNHVIWEGRLRNVSRYGEKFYVSISPESGYLGATASVTFEPVHEDALYAFRPDDRVRFEGVVERGGISLGIEGMAIELIE